MVGGCGAAGPSDRAAPDSPPPAPGSATHLGAEGRPGAGCAVREMPVGVVVGGTTGYGGPPGAAEPKDAAGDGPGPGTAVPGWDLREPAASAALDRGSTEPGVLAPGAARPAAAEPVVAAPDAAGPGVDAPEAADLCGDAAGAAGSAGVPGAVLCAVAPGAAGSFGRAPPPPAWGPGWGIGRAGPMGPRAASGVPACGVAGSAGVFGAVVRCAVSGAAGSGPPGGVGAAGLMGPCAVWSGLSARSAVGSAGEGAGGVARRASERGGAAAGRGLAGSGGGATTGYGAVPGAPAPTAWPGREADAGGSAGAGEAGSGRAGSSSVMAGKGSVEGPGVSGSAGSGGQTLTSGRTGRPRRRSGGGVNQPESEPSPESGRAPCGSGRGDWS